MQQQFGHYPVHPNMQGGQQGVGMGPGTSQRHEESFKSQATVFILKDKTWREQSQGVVQFVFDLNTYALRLIISPGTKEEMDRRLRPRIRSKGPRAYVVRAQEPNNGEDSILAVRFEREEDSQNFRKFVEKRDVDNNNPPNSHGNGNTGASGNRGGGGMQHTNTNNTNPQTVGTGQPYGQTYTQGNGNMYPNMGMMNQYTGKQGPAPTGQYPYDPYYQDPRNGGNGYYPNPNPQDYVSSTTPQQYRGPTSTMAQGGQTPHGSQHPSMGSYQYPPNNTGQNNLLQRPTNNSQWQQQQNGGPPYGPSNEGIVNDHYGGNNNNNNNNNNVGQNNNIDPNTGMPSQSYPNNHHGSRSGGANATINPGNQGNDPNSQPPQNVNILKLTEANLEAHNKVYAESSMANKRKNVRDIILEQLQWQRDHGMTSH